MIEALAPHVPTAPNAQALRLQQALASGGWADLTRTELAALVVGAKGPTAPDLTEDEAPTLPWPRPAPDGTPLGIDLGKPRQPGHPAAAVEVRKLVVAAMRGKGLPLDPDDVGQEVCMAIVRRNHCASAFDPRLAGFPKYVWTVCGNVVGHMLDSRKARRREQVAAEVPETVDERDPVAAFEDVDARRAAGLDVDMARKSVEAPAVQLGLFVAFTSKDLAAVRASFGDHQ